MSWLQQLGLAAGDSTSSAPSLWSEIRSGRAGCAVRIGLSLASAAVAVGLTLLVFGLVEARGSYVREEHAVIGLCLAAAAWCGAMAWIWSSYRRLRLLVRTIFTVLALWAATTPLCMVIDQALRRADFVIAGVIILAIGGTALIVTLAALRATGGHPIESAEGQIRVLCPGCGYTLVGLTSCQCPECGAAFTIDELIRAQNYAVLRQRRLPLGGEDESPDAVGPLPAAPALPQGACEK